MAGGKIRATDAIVGGYRVETEREKCCLVISPLVEIMFERFFPCAVESRIIIGPKLFRHNYLRSEVDVRNFLYTPPIDGRADIIMAIT